MNRRSLLAASALTLLLLVAGCEGGPQLGTVEGTVTYQGKPVADADVKFAPPNGTYGRAFTDENGHYELKFTPTRNGALVGECVVTISTSQRKKQGAVEYWTPELLPPEYTDGSLTRTVEPGHNVFDFDVK